MLRFVVRNKPRKLPRAVPGGGLQGRIDKMRKMVTALIRHERLEGKFAYMSEARGYAERLVQIASKHGDNHEPTMKVADYWLLEKDLIHKLFKVIVPRYEKLDSTSITAFHRLPDISGQIEMACLELKGNPWPPVVSKYRDVSGSLVNVLISQARKDYRAKKYTELMAETNISVKDTHVDSSEAPAVDASSSTTDEGTLNVNTDDNPNLEVAGTDAAQDRNPNVMQVPGKEVNT